MYLKIYSLLTSASSIRISIHVLRMAKKKIVGVQNADQKKKSKRENAKNNLSNTNNRHVRQINLNISTHRIITKNRVPTQLLQSFTWTRLLILRLDLGQRG